MFKAKGYPHKAVMRTAYLWLPVFAVVIFACSYHDKLRFILYATVTAATYAFILQQLKKKAVDVIFEEEQIIIADTAIPLSLVTEYHISLPLNELIIIRLKVNDRNESIYIDKDHREAIITYLARHHIPERKRTIDHYLQYGHLILPFIGLLICALMYQLCDQIRYAA